MKIKSIISLKTMKTKPLFVLAFSLLLAGAANAQTSWYWTNKVNLPQAEHEPRSVEKQFPISPAGGKPPTPPGKPKPPQPPLPPPVAKTVNGTVRMSVEDGGMPVAGALLYVWVQTPSTGYPFGTFFTDSLGRFNISGVPNNSTVTLHAGGNGGLQPCAAIGLYTTTNGLTKTITIFSIETLFAGAQPPAGSSPVLSGVVRDASTLQALPYAYLEMNRGPFGDLVAAETFADSSGNYFLGSVPNCSVTAVADGYDPATFGVLIGGDTTADILLNQTQ